MSARHAPPFHPLESQAERCLTLGFLGDAFDRAQAGARAAAPLDGTPADTGPGDAAPPSADPAAPVRTGGRIGDPAAWGSAAFLLAQGWSTSEVARWLGCDRSTVWRTLQRSEDLRRRVDAEKALLAAEAASRLAGLREEAVACLDHAIRKRGDVRVAMWLCDRLGLVAAARRRGAPAASVSDHAPAAHAPRPHVVGPHAQESDDPFRDADALGTPIHIDGLTRPAPAPSPPAEEPTPEPPAAGPPEPGPAAGPQIDSPESESPEIVSPEHVGRRPHGGAADDARPAANPEPSPRASTPAVHPLRRSVASGCTGPASPPGSPAGMAVPIPARRPPATPMWPADGWPGDGLPRAIG